MTTMLAARAYAQATSLAVERVAVPEPGPDDVLIKVASAGLTPGLMSLLAMGAFTQLPTTLGHEAAGHVEAVGADVHRGLLGKRVRMHPVLACRNCTYCRTDREQMCRESAVVGHASFGAGPLELYRRYHDGAFAEYVCVPYWLVDVLPDNIGFDIAAKVHDLGNAMRALKVTGLPPGGTLLVTAATGTMGTATIKLATFFGAGRLVLVGRSARRLEAAASLATGLPVETVAIEDLGPDWEKTQALTRRLREIVPAGVDAVTDYFPAGGGSTQALAALATGGTLVHMGANPTPFQLPAIALMRNLWRIVGSRTCTRTDTDQVLRLLANGVLRADELVTHRFPLTGVNDAVAALQGRVEPMWMAIINP